MKDIMGMMGKLQDMQSKMQQMQEEVENASVEGKAGGGLVTVTLSGKGEMRGVQIDPSLIQPDDVEMLEDLIVAAHADAKARADQLMQEKMQDVTEGLPIPPGMKLPF